MNVRLVHQLPPGENNPRNSEGAFIRGANGEILFAYSRYLGDSTHDHAPCDIALIVSYDEGETWSAPRVIAPAAAFGVKNVMSVSAVRQLNGDIAFYFLIKENDFSTTLGRAISSDGKNYRTERCRADFPHAYYVVNNDRVVRLSDGKLVAPAAFISAELNEWGGACAFFTTCLVSEDDGASFYKADVTLSTDDRVNARFGMQEPGILERSDGSLYLWIRTGYGRQYEAVSDGDVNRFTGLQPSQFTSPDSPMQIKTYDGVTYAVYNPVPHYDGRVEPSGCMGRTPLVIRKSTDDGRTFGPLNVIGDDPLRGYAYPAIFQTRDGHLLLSYCRGSSEEGDVLCRTGIAKAEISSIE